ncbi:TetR/AcrR family transcriptional regulator [Phenylobacterium sp.]|uniref:TetR/AcrR family transcriptional regulator n=1 Tax=Phenylobacterium sp. TaxID=1871053 RepID=UPI0025FDAD6C|nr:TetR/AcrR family transcriptional regulator [Phenylobacterium sp.]
MTKAPIRSPRNRLQPEARKAQIVEAAAALITQQGVLPLEIETLSQGLGISKGLVYSYFPTQYDLVNAILRHHLLGLLTGGLEAASRAVDPKERIRQCGLFYFEYVTANGSLLRILLSDRYMAGRIDADLKAAIERTARRLVRALRSELGLRARDASLTVSLLAAVPEEAGTHVFNKRVDPALARELCLEFMAGALEHLRGAQNDRRPTAP